MSKQTFTPRQQPGRSSFQAGFATDGRGQKNPQSATKYVARVTNSLLADGLARASLLAMPGTVETAKQRHVRTTAYNLRRIREGRQWTQEQLALYAGVRREQIVKWESGKDYEPGAENLEKLCRYLEVDEREFRVPILPSNAANE